MDNSESAASQEDTLKLCTFFIDGHPFGIDILKVQEIDKHLIITTVPQAPEFILGVMNLRGRIVTVIDLARKIGLSPCELKKASRIIIVNSHDEYIGLLVERIGDVIPVDRHRVESPPGNIGSVLGHFAEGVLKTDSGLIGILDTKAVLE